MHKPWVFWQLSESHRLQHSVVSQCTPPTSFRFLFAPYGDYLLALRYGLNSGKEAKLALVHDDHFSPTGSNDTSPFQTPNKA